MKKKLIWFGFGLLTFIVGWAVIPILASALAPVVATVFAASAVTVASSVVASCIVGVTCLGLNSIGSRLKKYLFGKEMRAEKKLRKRFERLKTLEEDIKFLKENKNLERKIDQIRFNEHNEFDLFLKNKVNDVKLNEIPNVDCENTKQKEQKPKYRVFH